MKRQVRNGVFETNSSSVHAISICVSKIDNSLNGKTIKAELGEFGWEYSGYTSILDRLSYLWTAIASFSQNLEGYDKKKYLEDWEERISGIFRNYDITVEFESPQQTNTWWYIDHYSELGQFLADLDDNYNLLERYLLDYNSEVRTGNDNNDDERPEINSETEIYGSEKGN